MTRVQLSYIRGSPHRVVDQNLLDTFERYYAAKRTSGAPAVLSHGFGRYVLHRLLLVVRRFSG